MNAGERMIIVSGQIFVPPERREAFLAASREAMAQARRAIGCRDFVVAADPLEPGRVNVHEEWDSDAALEAFRGDGPGSDLTADIVHADVARHHVASSGPASFAAGRPIARHPDTLVSTCSFETPTRMCLRGGTI
jgi:quinol monooxygenase YgiN